MSETLFIADLSFDLKRRRSNMTGKLSLAQLVYILLFLVLFPSGVAQLFFAQKIRDQLLRVRQYLERVYDRRPILLKVFGPPLKTLTLRGYRVGKRIG